MSRPPQRVGSLAARLFDPDLLTDPPQRSTVAAMGLFGKSRSSIRDGVRGTAEVVAATAYNRESAAAVQMCTIDCVVEAPGIPASAAQVIGLVKADRWPTVGQVLPVVIERTNSSVIHVLWDEVPDAATAARQLAEQRAAAKRAEDSL